MNDARNVCPVGATRYATIRSCCSISTAIGTRPRPPITTCRQALILAARLGADYPLQAGLVSAVLALAAAVNRLADAHESVASALRGDTPEAPASLSTPGEQGKKSASRSPDFAT
jgi:hypothetical protein